VVDRGRKTVRVVALDKRQNKNQRKNRRDMKVLATIIILLSLCSTASAQDIVTVHNDVYVCTPKDAPNTYDVDKKYDWLRYKLDREIYSRLEIERIRHEVRPNIEATMEVV